MKNKNNNFDFLELDILPYLEELKGKSIQEVIDYIKSDENWCKYKLIRFYWQGSYYNLEDNYVYKQNLLEL